jgi:hypothetical protein
MLYFAMNLNKKRMKNNNLLALLFCVFSFFGCNNKPSNNSNGSTQLGQTATLFKVSLKFIAEKKDDFCILYTEDGSINFGDQAIWKGFEGSTKEQTIDFEFPADVFPTQLRLDLGIKPEQADITLKSVILDYNGKKREIVGAEIGTLFRADENTCKFDAKTGIVKANVEKGTRQNPCLYPQEPTLKQEIEKLAN